MQEERFTKGDWVLFRKKIGSWQENYMDRLCKSYVELLNEDGDPSEKFWKLYKQIGEDKRSLGVLIHLSRSDFLYHIIGLLNDGVICMEDLEDFSDTLKGTINAFMEREKMLFADGGRE